MGLIVSIARLTLVLLSSLLVMLAVVMLRSERTRLRFEISQTERETEALRQEVRERELELARLSNPGLIRQRLMDMRIDGRPGPTRPLQP
jgi:hypothetical protein